MPKAQITISILMFMWAVFYLAMVYFLTVEAGIELAVEQIKESAISKLFVFPIALAFSYVVFGFSMLFYKSSLIYARLVKYGPAILAAIVTAESLPTKVGNLNWQVIGLGTILLMAAYILVPWLLAILSLRFVKTVNTNAT